MNRTPPAKVIRELRKEVNFVCPVKGCQSPFLTWHHFAPPWREENHHNPDGMIALCPEHHKQADSGAFSTQQLKDIKLNPANKIASAKFNWLRNRLLVIVGGCFFYEIYTIIEYQGNKIIWLKRDAENNLMLNFKMLSISNEHRASMENNQWISSGLEEEIVCPPSGRKVEIKYTNGDFTKVEFYEVLSASELTNKHVNSKPETWDIEFPITCVEIQGAIGGTEVKFSASSMVLPGNNSFVGGFMTGANVAISLR